MPGSNPFHRQTEEIEHVKHLFTLSLPSTKPSPLSWINYLASRLHEVQHKGTQQDKPATTMAADDAELPAPPSREHLASQGFKCPERLHSFATQRFPEIRRLKAEVQRLWMCLRLLEGGNTELNLTVIDALNEELYAAMDKLWDEEEDYEEKFYALAEEEEVEEDGA